MIHRLHSNKLSWFVSRTHIIVHSLAVSFFLYHRATSLLFPSNTAFSPQPPTLPNLILFLAELFLFLAWVTEHAYRWKPVNRSVDVKENISKEEEEALPAVDVIVCTADSEKEPTLEVMNTLISAMALEYPSDKLHVYLSDDAGADITLKGVKEAWSFATWWVPFCRKFRVKTICPEAYFKEEGGSIKSNQEKLLIKEKYEEFKERMVVNQRTSSKEETNRSPRDHLPVVEVINENSVLNGATFNPEYATHIPLLVYVAREKRSSHPHHFKAGGLNALLRVSGIISNSPIVLVLDCDMYCNDPTSVKQAVTFYMDPTISRNLAFVQFPQRFHNFSDKDIYDHVVKFFFKVLMQGFDGWQGPLLAGTGFYMQRKALYDPSMKGIDNLMANRCSFGLSNEFIKTLSQQDKRDTEVIKNLPLTLHEETRFVASCKYEDQTKWGEEVGFLYGSLVEDVFTGYNLHIKGWTSVYCDPTRAQFLGTIATNLNDSLIQMTRWATGIIEIGLTRFCPLIYKLSSPMMFSQRVCYTWVLLYPLLFLPIWCFATIPQIYLLHNIPIYPKVSTTLFSVMTFVFISSNLRNLYEVLFIWGDSFIIWSNQWRMWMIKGLVSYMYGSLDAIMKTLGIKETSFITTNKVMDDEQLKRYQHGVYDFQTSNMFLVPLGTVVILNLICFVGGILKMMIHGNWEEMLAQVFLSGFILIMSLPIIEGMILRNDKGRFPVSAAKKSVFTSAFIVLGSFLIL